MWLQRGVLNFTLWTSVANTRITFHVRDSKRFHDQTKERRKKKLPERDRRWRHPDPGISLVDGWNGKKGREEKNRESRERAAEAKAAAAQMTKSEQRNNVVRKDGRKKERKRNKKKKESESEQEYWRSDVETIDLRVNAIEPGAATSAAAGCPILALLLARNCISSSSAAIACEWLITSWLRRQFPPPLHALRFISRTWQYIRMSGLGNYRYMSWDISLIFSSLSLYGVANESEE